MWNTPGTPKSSKPPCGSCDTLSGCSRPTAETRKVTIFGSARTQPDKREYQQAVEFGRKMVEAGFMVITGAGPGIMQAGHEGAGPERSFGVNIRLPWEQSANPVIAEDKKLVTFKYFFTRKLTFVRHSDAIALFPGGFGTLDEGYEALTLMQTGKSQLMPLVLVDKPGGTYWKTWDRHVREHILRDELISPDDLNLYQITDDTDQAVRIITRFYRNFHSTRFVKDLLVIRMQHPPSDSAIAATQRGLCRHHHRRALPAYLRRPLRNVRMRITRNLPRMAFGFNRRDYGRLRQLDRPDQQFLRRPLTPEPSASPSSRTAAGCWRGRSQWAHAMRGCFRTPD